MDREPGQAKKPSLGSKNLLDKAPLLWYRGGATDEEKKGKEKKGKRKEKKGKMLVVRCKDGFISFWPGAEEESIDETVSRGGVVEDVRLVLDYEDRLGA